MKRRAWAWKASECRSAPLVGCFVVASALVHVVGCSVVGLFGRPGLGLYLSRLSAWAKFSSTFCCVFFVPRNNLETFFGAVFSTKRMWAAGGNTQYKSHLDLCHAFNWLLCRCHGCPLSSSYLSSSSSLARLPSISYEIEFGGGQRLKNTSGKVCAGLACCGMAG